MSAEYSDARKCNLIFGSALHDFRTKAGLTQTQLSKLTGITQSHISQLELGSWLPEYPSVTKLETALNVSRGALKQKMEDAWDKRSQLPKSSRKSLGPRVSKEDFTEDAIILSDTQGGSVVLAPDENSILVKRGVEAGLAAKMAADIIGLPKPQILAAQATAVGRATVPDTVPPGRHAAR